MTKVTDPALLAQLNGSTKVTDPALLAQLNGDAPQEPSLGDKLAKRAVTALTSTTPAFETPAQLAGAAGDVEGAVASTITPGIVKRYGKEALDAVADTKVGRAVSSGAKSVGKFGEENPVIGTPARIAGNLMGADIGAQALGKVAVGADAAKDAVKSGIQNTAGKAAEFHASDSALARGYKARTPEMLKKSEAAMKVEGDTLFKAARAAKERVTPEMAIAGQKKLETDLAKETGKIDPSLHGQTRVILDDMKASAKSGMDFEDIDIFRRRLREVERAGGEDGNKAGDAIELLDKQIAKTNGGAAWNKARDQWAKAKKFETISDIVRKSDGDINKAKKALRDLADNPKKNWGFNEQERAAIKHAGEYGTGESLLNFAGKFGFDVNAGNVKGSLGGTLGTIAALGAHTAGALPVVGTIAKTGQRYLGQAKIEDLLQNLESGGAALQKKAP